MIEILSKKFKELVFVAYLGAAQILYENWYEFGHLNL